MHATEGDGPGSGACDGPASVSPSSQGRTSVKTDRIRSRDAKRWCRVQRMPRTIWGSKAVWTCVFSLAVVCIVCRTYRLDGELTEGLKSASPREAQSSQGMAGSYRDDVSERNIPLSSESHHVGELSEREQRGRLSIVVRGRNDLPLEGCRITIGPVEVASGSDGQVNVELPPGRAQLRVVAPSSYEGACGWITVESGRLKHIRIALRDRQDREVELRVSSALDGQPIQGASVGEDEASTSILTDRLGLARLPFSGKVESAIRVSAEGYSDRYVGVPERQGVKRESYEILLAKGGVLDVRLIDALGQAVLDASVVLRVPGAGFATSGILPAAIPDRLESGVDLGMGVFRFSDLPVGAYVDVQADLDRYWEGSVRARTKVEADASELLLTLREYRNVIGRVVDRGGRGVGGVTVRAQLAESLEVPRLVGYPPSVRGDSEPSDADGFFVLRQMAPGDWDVGAISPIGVRTEIKRITLSEGDAPPPTTCYSPSWRSVGPCGGRGWHRLLPSQCRNLS